MKFVSAKVIMTSARLILMSHYDDTHWDRQKLLHFPIEILYADLWLLAAIHHFNTTPKALTYLLRTDKRRLWALHIGKVHAAVDMVDCSYLRHRSCADTRTSSPMNLNTLKPKKLQQAR